MKLSEISSYPEVYALLKNQQMPLAIAYRLAKFNASAEKENEFYITKLRELIDKYAVKDENGNLVPSADGEGVRIIPEMQEECMKAVQELQDLEVDYEPFLELNDLTSLQLTPEQASKLIPFIKE